MILGSIQGVVYFTRVVPAIGEPGASKQMELFSATSIESGVNLESQEEVTRFIEDASSEFPPGTPWVLIAYSNN